MKLGVQREDPNSSWVTFLKLTPALVPSQDAVENIVQRKSEASDSVLVLIEECPLQEELFWGPNHYVEVEHHHVVNVDPKSEPFKVTQLNGRNLLFANCA